MNTPNTMLRGERVLLRAVEPEDLDLMYIIENDAEMWQYGSSNVPYSSYALRRFIEETSNDIFRDGQLRLVIERREDGVAVGFIDLQDFDAINNRAEVGMAIVPEAQGKGYAKEALMLLCQYAGQRLHLHLLYSVISVTNDQAIGLFLGSDFVRSCVLPGWVRNGNGYSDAILFTLSL